MQLVYMAYTATASIPLHSEQLGVSRGKVLLVSLQHSRERLKSD